MSNLRLCKIFQVVCPVVSTVDLDEPIYETTIERLFLQVKGTLNMADLADNGFFDDEVEARQEAAARLRIQRDALEKIIIENDIALMKLREGQRGSPVRPVKTKKR